MISGLEEIVTAFVVDERSAKLLDIGLEVLDQLKVFYVVER